LAADSAGQLLKRWAAAGQDCALCGAGASPSLVCAECERRMPACFDDTPLEAIEVCAAFDYRFPVDRLVHRFKFAGDLAIGRWLATRLAQRVQSLPRPDLIVAPPLTPASLRRRGFNQALEIAKVVGRAHGVRVSLDALVKTRETEPQPSLGAEERRRNLRDAFSCRAEVRGLAVAIVDDVITTGGTALAIAQALRAAGALRVCAWSVARTPPPGR